MMKKPKPSSGLSVEKLKTIVVYFTLMLLVLNAHAGDGKKLRARHSFYRAKLMLEQQQLKKAKRSIRLANKLEPGNIIYQNALNHFKAQNRDALKPTRSNSNSAETSIQTLLHHTNNAIYYSQHGHHSKCRKALGHALDNGVQLENINDTLISHIFNNMACGIVMDQAVCFNKKTEPAPHLSIHMNILLMATKYFMLSLKHFPTNPTTLSNIDLIYNSLDSLDQPTLAKRIANKPVISEGNSKINTIKNEAPSHQGVKPHNKSTNTVTGPYRELIALLNSYDEVVLLLDNSSSMELTVSMAGPTRFSIMKQIVKNILVSVDTSVKLGCLTISGAYCRSEPVFKGAVGEVPTLKILNELETLATHGKTPLDLRMQQATALFSEDRNKLKMILVCSDGINTCNGFNTCEIASEIKSRGIDIHVLSLLDNKFKFLKEFSVYDCIATNGGGQLWKIDHEGGIEQIESKIPIMIYPLKLPVSLSKITCLGPNYHHTYAIYLPAGLIPDTENGWIVK